MVYRADDLKLGQPVALKFLLNALADDPVRHIRQALTLDSNDTETLWWADWFTARNVGRPDEALPYARLSSTPAIP